VFGLCVAGAAPGLITYSNLGRLRGRLCGERERERDTILHGVEGVEVTAKLIAMKKVVRV